MGTDISNDLCYINDSTNTTKPVINIYIKDENGNVKKLWNYQWITGSWGNCSVVCGGRNSNKICSMSKNRCKR